MKILKLFPGLLLFFLGALVFTGCETEEVETDNPDVPGDTTGTCYVQLFDGDHFKDDDIVLEGPAEYSDLDNLPGANGKNWTDEADSFIVGDSTTLIVWTKTNFEGDSTVYSAGEYPSVDEPKSLKIICGTVENGGDNGEADEDDPEEVTGCYIQLFDDDNFKDDNILLAGAGEYPDLKGLPGSDGRDWTDEADSFIVGDSTTVIVWTKTNFEGDSTVYTTGEYPSVDEPKSMKVICGTVDLGNDDGNTDNGDNNGNGSDDGNDNPGNDGGSTDEGNTGNDGGGNGGMPDACYIQLYDGDNFKDGSIIIEGAGEYADLKGLPGADGKDWTDEADSFIVGEGTRVTVWTKKNFEGESKVYEAGEYPSVDEPYSLKIECL